MRQQQIVQADAKPGDVYAVEFGRDVQLRSTESQALTWTVELKP